MKPGFSPKFHHKVLGCADSRPFWELSSVPSEQAAQERAYLVAEGFAVSWPAGEPGTGFVSEEERLVRESPLVSKENLVLGALGLAVFVTGSGIVALLASALR